MEFFITLKEELEKKEEPNYNVCLLSKEPLIDTETITLDCGHKFNYSSLYNEMLYIKNNKNCYSDAIKLQEFQMKCPYCRTVQNNILPYIPGMPGIKKIKNINYPKKYCLSVNKCSYKFKSGKKKGLKCEKVTCGTLCFQHLNILKKNIK